MGFSDELRADVEDTWQASIRHRFVRELLEDTVPEQVLRRYLVQDYQFVDSFVALLGAAIATADSADARLVLARQLGMVASEENTYFHRSFDALAVPTAERDAPRLAAPTIALRAMMDTAHHDYAHCLTVLTVAEWLYADWAARAESLPANKIAAEWVELHANPDFDEWVRWLRGELDRVGAAAPPQVRSEITELFRATVAEELAFFAAAYTG
jgi:thiaminase/transcriptional activator TenA